MSFQIVVDSCCDLTPEMRGSGLYHNVPLTIYVGESAFRDDMALDTQDLVDAMAMCQEASHTACPAPADYLSMFERCDGDLYVVTLSALLSGSHNSAWQASRLFLEEHPERNIHVFNSCSASSGETLIAAKIAQLAGAGLPFAEVVETVDRYITEMNTLFVLENLDTLRKNGRLTGLQAFFATALNIKPVMAGDKGVIVKLEQARGMNKALGRMTEIALKQAGETKDRRLVIAHCNNRARAEYVRDLICSKAQFKDVVITDTAGVATVYANDGGIILTL